MLRLNLDGGVSDVNGEAELDLFENLCIDPVNKYLFSFSFVANSARP